MEQFLQVNQMFWEGSRFQWLFYGSIILIVLFDKNKARRLVFGIYPIVMLATVATPLVPRILDRFFYNTSLYYVRLFSVIPVFYCIVHGILLLLDKAKGLLKVVGVCAAFGVIMLAGHCILQEPWMMHAANLEKIPDGAKEVIEAIPREKDNICVAFPQGMNVYARQIDATIKMPYGRYWGSTIPLLDALSQPVPDAPEVMRLAGERAVDYVVVKNNEEKKESFSSAGYEPVGETDRYLIYAVTGVEHVVREYNDKNQIIAETPYDAEGNPITNIWGYTTTLYEYDRHGFRIKETYADAEKNVFTLHRGCASIKRGYTFSGLVDSIIYLDANDRPVLCTGQCETRYTYDSRRRVIQEKYFDENGEPLLVSGRYETRFVYDDNNRIIQESYYDENGKLMNLSNSVFAVRNFKYEEDRIVAESYRNVIGEPVNINLIVSDNLVWNGDFCAGSTRWSQWGWPELCEVKEVSGHNWLHLVSSGVHWEGLRQDVSERTGNSMKAEVFAGQTYTLSLEAYAAEGWEGKPFSYGLHIMDLGDGGLIEECWSPVLTLSSKPQRYSYTFTPASDGTFCIYVGTGQDEVIDAYFSNVVLTKVPR